MKSAISDGTKQVNLLGSFFYAIQELTSVSFEMMKRHGLLKNENFLSTRVLSTRQRSPKKSSKQSGNSGIENGNEVAVRKLRRRFIITDSHSLLKCLRKVKEGGY